LRINKRRKNTKEGREKEERWRRLEELKLRRKEEVAEKKNSF